MELLLIRHALPVRIENQSARADPDLSEVGFAQAKALARWLSGDGIHTIYVSPLARARQTATPIAATLGLEPIVDDDLAEWDRDAREYIPMEELKATGHELWDAMANHRWDDLGIDIDAFRSRVTSSIDGIAARNAGERVAVVCHGGVINTYTATVLGLADLLFFEPDYTSISRVLVSRGGTRSIKSINETAHLRDLRRTAGR